MNEKRFLDRLMEMIAIDSPSLMEKPMSEYLIKHFKERGLEVSADDSGREYGSSGQNVLVHIPGSLSLPPICFNAHMDTVEPGRGIEAVFEEGRLRSAGDTILGADDKAGIAMLLEAYEELREKGIPHREMYFLFTIGEEIMRGADHYDTSGILAKYMFILDGAGAPKYLCRASKGKMFLKCRFHGKSAHAGVDLHEGINAVCMASDGVVSIREKTAGLRKETALGTTLNVSSIRGGEDGPTVPSYAEVTIELRSFSQEEMEELSKIIKKEVCMSAEKYGGKAFVEAESVCRPYHAQTEEYLYKRTGEAIINEGLDPVEVMTGGSSDGNIFGERGFVCSGLGIGIYNVHTTEEYMELEETKAAYRIMLDIMTR